MSLEPTRPVKGRIESGTWQATASGQAMTQKRNNFRIHYPHAMRPTLSIDHVVHQVLDLSEKGIKFALGERYRPQIKDSIVGTLKFANRRSIPIAGTVLRLSATYCVARLTLGVPLQMIQDEERAVLRTLVKE